MLDILFTNQNIERILLFLFVNRTGYGSQICALLGVSLTPLQAALNKLEQGGYIRSYTNKNKKMFELNPDHPLFREIESLLKKAYSLLKPEEKNRYFFTHKPSLKIQKESQRDLFRKKELKKFFNRLSKVSFLKLNASLKKGHQSDNKEGHATVLISQDHINELIFHEKGVWQTSFQEVAFSNTFRFTLDEKAQLISLEHLRYGFEKPVFLFNLTTNQPHFLESVNPHICSEDVYLGNIQWSKNGIVLSIRIIGPKKNDLLTYTYT